MATVKAVVLFVAAFAALATLSQGYAYTLTLSSYVEAVKQVEILFAMAIGILVFGERQRVRESAPGAVVMLVSDRPSTMSCAASTTESAWLVMQLYVERPAGRTTST